VWAYDFVFDTCASGRTFEVTVIDEFTRECLAIDVAGGIRSGRVIEVLTQLVSIHGGPRYLRSDNGPEFVARGILRWLEPRRIETAFIDPGKPWQNGAEESFNGKFRDITCRCNGFGIARTRRSASRSGGIRVSAT
jgi:putative transposase